jgi:hypothetical protein
MSQTTIPYGDRAILVADNFVYFCDKVLLRSDFDSDEALMAEIDRIYKSYQQNLVGEAAELYQQYLAALERAKNRGL